MTSDLAPQLIPRHIAIIMDGNGRWAQKKGLPRIAGHQQGVESLKEIVKSSAEFGVKYLSVYVFSTENWQRPRDEVKFLMDLLGKMIDREVGELNQNNVRLRFLGRIHELSPELNKKISGAMKATEKNDGLNLAIMVNYGGRAEIIDAVRAILRDKKKPDEIDEAAIKERLYGPMIPDPDLLIRTGGEQRISNFLLWQIAYSEILVTETLWPEFRREHLLEAMAEYQKRNRRFGRVENDT